VTRRLRQAFVRGVPLGLFGLLLLHGTARADSSRDLAERLRAHPGTRAAVTELAEAGVVDAMLMLCRFHGPGSAGEGRRWCARAAEAGSLLALREFGVALATESRERELRREGLTLLALAELVRDAESAAILVVLPEFAPVGAGEIADARDEALERIDGLIWVDARRLGLRLEPGEQEQRRAESNKARLRERAALISRSGPGERAQQLRRRRLASRSSLGVSEGDRAAYRRRLAEDDRRQRLINDREAAEAKAARLATGEERARLDRAAYRRRGAELRAGLVAPALRRRLTVRLSSLLDRINRHRAPAQALHLQDLDLERAWSSEEP